MTCSRSFRSRSSKKASNSAFYQSSNICVWEFLLCSAPIYIKNNTHKLNITGGYTSSIKSKSQRSAQSQAAADAIAALPGSASHSAAHDELPFVGLEKIFVGIEKSSYLTSINPKSSQTKHYLNYSKDKGIDEHMPGPQVRLTNFKIFFGGISQFNIWVNDWMYCLNATKLSALNDLSIAVEVPKPWSDPARMLIEKRRKSYQYNGREIKLAIGGYITYSIKQDTAFSVSYLPLLFVSACDKQGLRRLPYIIEFMAVSVLACDGVKYISTTQCPSPLRTAQLSRIGLPVNQAVPVSDWLSSMKRGAEAVSGASVESLLKITNNASNP